MAHTARRALERDRGRARRRRPDDRAAVRRSAPGCRRRPRAPRCGSKAGIATSPDAGSSPSSGSVGSRPCVASSTERSEARRSGPRSSTCRRSKAGSGRSSFVDAGQAARPDEPLLEQGARRCRRGSVGVQRGASLRPQSPAHARHRGQGAIRHRRPGGAMSTARHALVGMPGRGARLREAGYGHALRTARLDGALDRHRYRGLRRAGHRRVVRHAPPDRDPGASRETRGSASRSTTRAPCNPGSYPIRPPASAEHAAPAAALAVRWFSKTAVQGYQGESGNVTLRRASNGELSGTFTAKAPRSTRAHASASPGRSTASGSSRPPSGACRRRATPPHRGRTPWRRPATPRLRPATHGSCRLRPMESTYFRRGFGLKAEIEGQLTADYHSAVVERCAPGSTGSTWARSPSGWRGSSASATASTVRWTTPTRPGTSSPTAASVPRRRDHPQSAREPEAARHGRAVPGAGARTASSTSPADRRRRTWSSCRRSV